jgi:hypothetical protein
MMNLVCLQWRVLIRAVDGVAADDRRERRKAEDEGEFIFGHNLMHSHFA